jgi:glycogen operon protein
VVFNHTAEGDGSGPTLSFKGVDNPTYYILEKDGSRHANCSRTGNTLNADHPVVRGMILDSLRHWVEAMHVDRFRFALASIPARDSSGHPLANPAVLWDIESDPSLASAKIIAEAWDAAGLYQVGSFIGERWMEWNGKFRDEIRAFFRCEPGSVRRLADRMVGSPEIYGHEEREAEPSVNFVTCHDGVTLNDLVSYDQKHNEANGEGSRDGTDDNRSWNCGTEGSTNDPAIERLRNRQVKNFLTVTMFSLGVPTILMGDEVRRTQNGNNNAYCHGNEISWLDLTQGRKTCGPASVRQIAPSKAPAERNRLRSRTPDFEPVNPGGKQGLAWCNVEPARLERPFPQPGIQRRNPWRKAVCLYHRECLLGLSYLRASAGGERIGATVAAMD